MSDRTVACSKGCGTGVSVPREYDALTDAGVEALGLICPACLKKIANENFDLAIDHIGGILENIFTVGATAATAAKQQLKPAARGALLKLRDRLNQMLDQETTPPSSKSQ